MCKAKARPRIPPPQSSVEDGPGLGASSDASLSPEDRDRSPALGGGHGVHREGLSQPAEGA